MRKTLQDALADVGNRIANSESVVWQRQMDQQISEDSIFYEPVTEDSMRQVDTQQAYFNNEVYQLKTVAWLAAGPRIYRLWPLALRRC